jgi:hypothetical protein
MNLLPQLNSTDFVCAGYWTEVHRSIDRVFAAGGQTKPVRCIGKAVADQGNLSVTSKNLYSYKTYKHNQII